MKPALALSNRPTTVEFSAVSRLLIKHGRLAILQLLAPAFTLVVIVGLLPLIAGRAAWGRIRTGRWLETERVLGRHGQPIQPLSFSGPMIGRSLARLWHVLTGELTWVGPRPIKDGEMDRLATEDLIRLEVPPGLVSLADVRRRMGLAHDGALLLDRTMAVGWRRRDSPALLIKAAIARVLCPSQAHRSTQPLSLFGVEIDNRTMSTAVDELIAATEKGKSFRVAFVNPDCLNIAYRDPRYVSALRRADRVYADGIGLRIAARWRGVPMADNVNGTDLFPRLCQGASERGLSLYLLGARPGVAAAAAEAIRDRFPTLRIVGTQHGYFERNQSDQICRQISSSGADILLVAMGSPRQDFWLERHHPSLGVPVALGVGGLFDFYSGRIPRAPQGWRDLGLEWLFRLTREPGRLWRRYLIGNPLFLWRSLLYAHTLPGDPSSKKREHDAP